MIEQMSDLPTRARRRYGSTIARHGQLSAPGPIAIAAKYLGVALAVVLVSTLTVVGIAVWGVASSIKPGVSLIGETGAPPNVGAIEGGVNLLLVGSDSGEGDPRYGKRDATLNDVNILLHISEDHTHATVVSFPRDLFVPVPECPDPDGGGMISSSWSAKLNTTLERGGLACTVETISQFTGLDIPFAAKIEMNGVIQMSNAVGGVDVCVATPINDLQIGLKLDAGIHTLQGDAAQLFLRTRYGVGDGSDLGRINNQYVFLSSLMRTVKSSETLSDPIKLYGLAKAAAENMQLSNSLQNLDTMMSIALALKDIPLDAITFAQYPTAYGSSGGLQGVLPLQADGEKLMDALKSDVPITLTGDTGGGAVLAEGENGPATPAPSAPADPGTAEPGTPETGAPGTAEPPSTTGPPVVELPDTIHGQTAAQQTCSAGQTARG